MLVNSIELIIYRLMMRIPWRYSESMRFDAFAHIRCDEVHPVICHFVRHSHIDCARVCVCTARQYWIIVEQLNVIHLRPFVECALYPKHPISSLLKIIKPKSTSSFPPTNKRTNKFAHMIYSSSLSSLLAVVLDRHPSSIVIDIDGSIVCVRETET